MLRLEPIEDDAHEDEGSDEDIVLDLPEAPADIDPAEISKNRVADVPMVGDCLEVITELLAVMKVKDVSAALQPLSESDPRV